MRALPLLLVAALLAGCSGFSIGPRQDKDDAAAFARVLAAQGPGRAFPARELLGKDWSRMWVFPQGIDTQLVEDRIGIPFPQSAEEPNVDDGLNYVVFDDGETVVSAFVPSARVEVRPECLVGDRRPLGPGTTLEVLPGEGQQPRRLVLSDGDPSCG